MPQGHLGLSGCSKGFDLAVGTLLSTSSASTLHVGLPTGELLLHLWLDEVVEPTSSPIFLSRPFQVRKRDTPTAQVVLDLNMLNQGHDRWPVAARRAYITVQELSVVWLFLQEVSSMEVVSMCFQIDNQLVVRCFNCQGLSRSLSLFQIS